jgi:hypothetical protein
MSKKYQPKPKAVYLCPICQQLFMMNRTDHRYCSDACRQAAHRSKEPRAPLTAAEFKALDQQFNLLTEKIGQLMAKRAREKVDCEKDD